MDLFIKFKFLLSPILAQMRMSEICEKLHPEAFGSGYSIFQNNSTKIRIIWDGKDSWGYIQFWNENSWEDIPIYLTKLELENEKVINEKVNKMFVTIEEIS